MGCHVKNRSFSGKAERDGEKMPSAFGSRRDRRRMEQMLSRIEGINCVQTTAIAMAVAQSAATSSTIDDGDRNVASQSGGSVCVIV